MPGRTQHRVSRWCPSQTLQSADHPARETCATGQPAGWLRWLVSIQSELSGCCLIGGKPIFLKRENVTRLTRLRYNNAIMDCRTHTILDTQVRRCLSGGPFFLTVGFYLQTKKYDAFPAEHNRQSSVLRPNSKLGMLTNLDLGCH